MLVPLAGKATGVNSVGPDNPVKRYSPLKSEPQYSPYDVRILRFIGRLGCVTMKDMTGFETETAGFMSLHVQAIYEIRENQFTVSS